MATPRRLRGPGLDQSRPSATVEDLSRAAQAVENNEEIDPGLAEALARGSSVGGAWPKALLDDPERPRIAKFATRRSLVTPLKYEYVAMKMAKLAGVTAAEVELIEVLDSPSFSSTDSTEWARTDDHAKNHSVFWDGEYADLTPAYDIAPPLRSGGETVQAMAYGEEGQRFSNVHLLINEAPTYLTSAKEAHQILEQQVAVITDNWDALATDTGMTEAESTKATSPIWR